MNFIKALFNKKEERINSYADFWAWFLSHEREFYEIVKEKKNIVSDFFDKLSPRLHELKDGYFFLAGMLDENTAELVFTADGHITNFVFVEELVNAAPPARHWKFTAHKPELAIDNVDINLAGFTFNQHKLSFFSNEDPRYPDEIDITVVHPDFTGDTRDAITRGAYIFLDNYLGELNFVTSIDRLNVMGPSGNHKELIAIGKLKDYLNWRQKEFVEKYEGERYNAQNDSYASMEGELENGRPLVAIVNTTLLNWSGKASHPWVLSVEIQFNGEANNGMPGKDMYELLNRIEDDVITELKDVDGYLNIGRQTADGVREIYFACKEFRKPSRVLHNVSTKYKGQLTVGYDIYKDKYWRTFERFAIS